MRYIQIVSLLCLVLTLGLLSACQTSQQGWNFEPEEQQAAQDDPKALSRSTLENTNNNTDQYHQTTQQSQENQVTKAQNGTYLPPSAPQQHKLSNLSLNNKIKVGILLPLSGPQEQLGKKMLNAAQLALFDIAHDNFELITYDTQGTGDGARQAAQNAIKNDVQLILGPVFSNSVKAAKNVVKYHNINMITFSTDWSLTSANVFTMGFLPFDQIERIISYAAQNGLTRIAVVAPNTKYGNAITSAYQTLANLYNIQTVDILTFDPQSQNLAPQIRSFARYDERTAQARQEVLSKMARMGKKYSDSTINIQTDQKKIEMAPPYDAVLIAAGSQSAIAIANLLSHYDLPPNKVKRLGLGLFDDRSLTTEIALKDAWFAAPGLSGRADFERRYKETFGHTPPRLASLSHDATALAAILARRGIQRKGSPDFDRQSITNPNGFAGIDGIFRFLNNGTVERGLAILKINKGSITEQDPASGTFQKPTLPPNMNQAGSISTDNGQNRAF